MNFVLAMMKTAYSLTYSHPDLICDRLAQPEQNVVPLQPITTAQRTRAILQRIPKHATCST